MYNPFMFSMMIFRFQMELAQGLLLAGSSHARPSRRTQPSVTLVAVNHWRLPQRSRAVLSLVQ